ncbi:MAG: thiol:disulfide interchange protein DsbA/DsbL [Rhodoferax sp.]|nr:thiol:disulfide interchange protein DsbA/DsbL [Rhodoferax sp.]
MKRREFSLAAASALAASTLAVPAARAQGQKFVAGTDYLVLDKRAMVETPPGKVEVIEFFWYSCPHCNAFEPALDSWVSRLPKNVNMRRVPVAFNASFVPEQRLYYALEAMGKLDELHVKVFYAIHVEHQPLNREDGILAWVQKQGLDKAKFVEAYNSFSVATKVRRATQLQDDYKVSGVPALGVAGRFYIDGELAHSMERALQITDYLIGESRKSA